MKRKKKPEPEPETCPYCGTTMATDEKVLSCPWCLREGCNNCMPAGRGCLCPNCENTDEDKEVYSNGTKTRQQLRIDG